MSDMCPVDASRTQRFAQFLRAAVEVKTRKVTDVAKYPSVQWFSDLPRDLAEIRSPLLSDGWDADDLRWLVVSRVPEPDLPPIPRVCEPWLEGIDVRGLSSAAELLTSRMVLDENGAEVSIPPGHDVYQAWQRYVGEKWEPWAKRVRVARLVKPVYQRLFNIHQDMQGREDAYDLFVGIGLYADRTDPAQPLRRHLLAYPAELLFDSRTGTFTLAPAADFDRPRLELDFLRVPQRTLLQPHVDQLQPLVSELGPAIQPSVRANGVIETLVNALGIQADYTQDLSPQEAPASRARASFAPAVILRPRSTRSLDDLLARIERDAIATPPRVSPSDATVPWRRLLEDDRVWHDGDGSGERRGTTKPPKRIYFPLPSNEEQSKIVRLTDGTAGVVVQGPPGTGKSHTIANLISHYLATGRRVLVTAQTAQALQVLRDKLPAELQALCVSLLGASSASDKDLERSVRGILSRHQDTDDAREFEVKASVVEKRLVDTETKLAALERVLHDARVSETTTVQPVVGYRGSRAAIARQLSRESATLAWISDEIPHETPCPSYAAGWGQLSRYHDALTKEVRARLAKRWIPLPFPAEEAIRVVEAICAVAGVDLGPAPAGLPPLPGDASAEALDHAHRWLLQLSDLETVPSPDDRMWIHDCRLAVMTGDLGSWKVVFDDASDGLVQLGPAVVGAIAQVTVEGNKTRSEALRDMTRLSAHYNAGGKRRSLGVIRPSVVRETEWVERAVRVDGLPIRSAEEIENARAALDGLQRLDRAWKIWDQWPADRRGSARQQVAALVTRLERLRALLSLGSQRDELIASLRSWLAKVAAGNNPTPDLLLILERHLAALTLATLRAHRDRLLDQLRAVAPVDATPSLYELQTGLIAEDLAVVRQALEHHRDEQREREHHSIYLKFIQAVRVAAPLLADSIVLHEGTSEWVDRFDSLELAWRHRCAAVWLATVLSAERIEAAARAARDERTRIQELTAELTGALAWFHALQRIDERRRQSLVAWSQTVANIPKTGPSVFRRRLVARTYLSKCLDAIPAWVVSLGRLYDTIDALPGLFDVAIVDEASQCWLDSLVLFYLAKQVIIVGDDKQISPTMVGVREGEVERLAGAFLKDFEHRGMFTIESSLFDHSRRYLPASVPLREHFRCVPEIIRFSNELSYTDNPLIPLRQCGKDRLEPLKFTFIPGGNRVGDLNEAEARAVVEAVVSCHEDDRYDDCDFGVICLQGDDQAARIQQLLLERLGPGVFAERNLRCGDAYAFQGDERDVVFLSMVAAPNADNAPLTTKRFEQRFNVALSRARDQAWLFHSVREHDTSPHCLRRRVISFFYQPADQTIRGSELDVPTLRLRAERADRQTEGPPVPFESWFEIDVALALVARGYQLSAQVQVAKKRIDLVVEGEGVRLAVECDGEAWHGPEQYERDMFRQRQLERAQWRFVRVRESMFYSDEQRAIDEVLAACEELGIAPGSSRASAKADTPVASDSPFAFSGPVERPVSSIDQPSPEVRRAVPRQQSMIEACESVNGNDDVDPSQLLSQERSGPYSGYAAKGYPDPRTAPSANVQHAVLDIVRTDGPLPKASIYALYREGCPRVERAGKALKHAVNSAIAVMQRMKSIVVVDEGTDRDPTEVVVRLPGQEPVVLRPRGDRQIEGIPLSELAWVFRDLAGASQPRTGGESMELQRRVLERFDLRNLTARTRARLVEAERLASDEQFWMRLGSGASLS